MQQLQLRQLLRLLINFAFSSAAACFAWACFGLPKPLKEIVGMRKLISFGTFFALSLSAPSAVNMISGLLKQNGFSY
jgi:hypothetical protein